MCLTMHVGDDRYIQELHSCEGCEKAAWFEVVKIASLSLSIDWEIWVLPNSAMGTLTARLPFTAPVCGQIEALALQVSGTEYVAITVAGFGV